MKKLLLFFGILPCTLIAFGQLPAYLPNSGLVAWYPFNGNANDESGNGNNGTPNGAILTMDRFSNANAAYSFASTDISIAATANFDLNVFTVSGWIKTTSTGTGYETMFSHWIETPGGSLDYYGYWVGVYQNMATLYMADGAGGEIAIQSTNAVNDGQWHFILATYDGATGSIYLDGVWNSSAPYTMWLASCQTNIGNDYSSEAFTGDLDDIGVWNVVLDQCAIERLYAAQILHTGTDVQSACYSYTWMDGNTYASNNNSATYTIAGGAYNGCDSIVTLDLIIDTVDTSTSVNGLTITSNASPATYQWMDCNNGDAILVGETGASFTPTVNGNYAVIVNQNGCTDTSVCVAITTVGLNEEGYSSALSLYPNPASNYLILKVREVALGDLAVLNILGQEMICPKVKLDPARVRIDTGGLPKGVYLLSIRKSVMDAKMIRFVVDR